MLDFNILLAAIPHWMNVYSTSSPGCGYQVVATIKAEASQAKFVEFVGDVSSSVPSAQRRSLRKVFHLLSNYFSRNVFYLSRKEEALSLWHERCIPTRVV